MPESEITTSMRGCGQFVKRDEHGARQPSVAVETRRSADERERLRDRRAFGLQIVRAPENHRDRLGERVASRSYSAPADRAACRAPSCTA